MFGTVGDGSHDFVCVRYGGFGDSFVGELDGVREAFAAGFFDVAQMGAIMDWQR